MAFERLLLFFRKTAKFIDRCVDSIAKQIYCNYQVLCYPYILVLDEGLTQICPTIDKIKEMKIVVPGAHIGQVDAIIVTPIMEYTHIQENLKKFYSCQFLSITLVLFNVDYNLQTE